MGKVMKPLSNKRFIVLLLLFSTSAMAVEVTNIMAVAVGVGVAAAAIAAAAPVAVGLGTLGVIGGAAQVALLGASLALSGLDWSDIPNDAPVPPALKDPANQPNPGGGTPIYFDLPKAPLNPDESPYLDNPTPKTPGPLQAYTVFGTAYTAQTRSAAFALAAGAYAQYNNNVQSPSTYNDGSVLKYILTPDSASLTFPFTCVVTPGTGSSNKAQTDCDKAKANYGNNYPVSMTYSSSYGTGCGTGYITVNGNCKPDPEKNPLYKKPPLVRKPNKPLEPNPANPPPDAVITTHNPDGTSTTRTINSSSGTGTGITSFPDGSTTITNGTRLPNGLDIGTTWYIDPSGKVVGGNGYTSNGSTDFGGSSPGGGSTDGGASGGTSGGSSGTGGTGTGGSGTGSGTGTGSGSGDCASYGCAKESTLQSLFGYVRSMFEGNGAAFSPSEGPSGSERARSDLGQLGGALNGAGSYSGVFSRIGDAIGLPAGGQCQNASISFTLFGRSFNAEFVSMCQVFAPIVNWFFWILIAILTWREIQYIASGRQENH